MGSVNRRDLAALLGVLLIAPLAARAQYYEDRMEPEELYIQDIEELRIPAAVYVGNDVCRLCHEAAYQTWLGTAHSRGFVRLYSPKAMAMGEKMGVTADMAFRSGKCMQCHALAHDVPAAYRGPGFRMGEGVTCERCHGPGGDHVRAFEDPESSIDGVLGVPEESFCRGCHHAKVGHEGVESKLANFAKARKRIAHPMAAEQPEDQLEPSELGIWHVEETRAPAASYVGSAVCGTCHEAPYERWQQSAHSGAFYAMRSEMGYTMDMQQGVTVGGPAKNGMCLSCHATGSEAPAIYRASGFEMREGVGCEKCHGPGGDHVSAVRHDDAVDDMGLVQAPSKVPCKTCHKRKKSHARLGTEPFAPAEAWEAIAH